jgi:SAM-dependent methyltransferase
VSVHLSLRLARFLELIKAHVPIGNRVLEVGCGDGELALGLSDAGYVVTAIDPRAPEGEIFRRERLEDFDGDRRFDAIVAGLSLHHVADLGVAIDRIAGLLEPSGLLLLDEFARERFVGETACWYHERRRERDPDAIPADFDVFIERWHADHDDVHPFDDVRAALATHFSELLLERAPYLYDYHLDDSLEPLERDLIEAGTIEPIGIRYVGRIEGLGVK